MERKPLTKQRSPWVRRPDQDITFGEYRAAAWCRNVSDGTLWALVAEEPEGWHLSISFRNPKQEPSRYPTWDEIAHARDELTPADVAFVMHLPLASEYVAHHDSTFHIHEHPERPVPTPGRAA